MKKEKALIVIVQSNNYKLPNIEDYTQEMKSLVKTAGAKVKEVIIQNLQSFNPAFLIGKGKVEELKEIITEKNIDTIIFGNNLSPLQISNLTSQLNIKIIDRSELILDIFAQHAKSREGKIKVELAQLKYRLPLLTGKGIVLSRLGGGIGTRGPGETKLEVDRRRIKTKISYLEKSLYKIRKNRSEQKKRRLKSGLPLFTLIGYTNVGKSSILNMLTNSTVLVEDKLFATLDTKAARVYLGKNRYGIISDTVGIIENLPNNLQETFKATIEEAADSDFLIIVLDASNKNPEKEIQSVHKLLIDLNITDKETIYLFNKTDKLETFNSLLKYEKRFEHTIYLSTVTKRGKDLLLKKMGDLSEKKFNYLYS